MPSPTLLLPNTYAVKYLLAENEFIEHTIYSYLLYWTYCDASTLAVPSVSTWLSWYLYYCCQGDNYSP